MKNIKYLLLMIMLLPITAFAEVTHITQSDIEDAYNNAGSTNAYTGIEYVNYFGFVFHNEEYTLDEDIDLHRRSISSGNNSLIINLNGYNITQDLPYYSDTSSFYGTIQNCYEYETVVNTTINGPGYIYGGEYNSYTVNNFGGSLTLNNVTVYGGMELVDYFGKSNTVINNSVINDEIHQGSNRLNTVLTATDSTFKEKLNVNGNATANITNSSLEGGADAYDGGKLTVNNVTVGDLIQSYDDGTLIINDSSINQYVYGGYNAKLEINRSNITNSVYADVANVEINDTTYDSYIPMTFTYCIANINNSNIHSETIGLISLGENPMYNYSPQIEPKLNINNTYINGEVISVALIGDLTANISNTEIYSQLGVSLLLSMEPELTMSDVYLHNETATNEYPIILDSILKQQNVIYDNLTEEQLINNYKKYLKEGYIYYQDPEYVDDYITPDSLLDLVTERGTRLKQILGIGLSRIGGNNQIDEISAPVMAMLNPDSWTTLLGDYFRFTGMDKRQIKVIKENNEYIIPEEPEYNDDDVTVIIDGDPELIENVEINGQELTPNDYSIFEVEGKKVGIKINNNYLKDLDKGDYTLKVTFVNGDAETTIKVNKDEPVQEDNKTDNKEKEDVKGEVENPKTGLFNYLLLLIPLTIGIIAYLKVSNKTIFKRI